MEQCVAVLLKALRRFTLHSTAWPPSEHLRRAQAGATALLSILTDDLAGPALQISAAGRFGRADTIHQWRRKYYYIRRHLLDARKELDKLKGGNRIGKHWLVVACLSDPRTSVRTVASWCHDFAIDDAAPISYGTVSTVRNAFGEILRGINRQDISKYAVGVTDGFIVVRHLHDEATMRLRSDLPAAPAAAGLLARGRSSKIQNSVVTLRRNVVDEALPVLLELQPLGSKDVGTMATALRSVIDTIVPAVMASWVGRSARISRCLVGDGIFTNVAAARLLWSWAQAAPVAPHYRLLTFTCSTHAANLAVRSAITNDEHQRNVDVEDQPLVATCVRFSST